MHISGRGGVQLETLGRGRWTKRVKKGANDQQKRAVGY